MTDNVKTPEKEASESFFVKTAALIDRCHESGVLLALGPADNAYKLVGNLSQRIFGKSDSPMKDLALSFERLYNDKSTKKEIISTINEWRDVMKTLPKLDFKDIKKSPAEYQKYFTTIIKQTLKTAKKLLHVLKEMNKKQNTKIVKGNSKSK